MLLIRKSDSSKHIQQTAVSRNLFFLQIKIILRSDYQMCRPSPHGESWSFSFGSFLSPFIKVHEIETESDSGPHVKHLSPLHFLHGASRTAALLPLLI